MQGNTQISEALRLAIDSPTVERLAEVLSINKFGKSYSEHIVAILAPRLEAALAGHVVGWRDIESAPTKPEPGEYSPPTVRLWDGNKERQGRYDDNRFSKKPKPYWRYSDSIGVASDRASQPTHWAPLSKGPTPPALDLEG